MAQITLRDNIVNTIGQLPIHGSLAPDFKLIGNDLNIVELSQFKGKYVVLNIFPSIDTRVCAMSVREFNQRAARYPDTVVLCISRDLPYAFKRFCGAEGIANVITLSDFRNLGFAQDYGVEMMDGIMVHLLARAVVVLDQRGIVVHAELVPSIGQEPDYDAALKSLA